MKTLLVSTIAAIAALNPEGFTVNLSTLQPVNKGYAVASSKSQFSFDREGINNILDIAIDNDDITAVGGWYNKEEGLYYFDAVIIINNLSDAIRAGRANKQIDIFDSSNNKEIRL